MIKKSFWSSYFLPPTPRVMWENNSRNKKAKKILAVLSNFSPAKLNKLNCLDVGCSWGKITSLLGKHFKKIVGIDIDKKAIAIAKKKFATKKIRFKVASGLELPFADKTFDALICNHLDEHVADLNIFLDEVYRVMKDDAFCYFAASNKFVIWDWDYPLPFVSWLPKKMANFYVRLFGMGKVYDVNLYSVYKLKKMLNKFEIKDYTLEILKNPNLYQADDLLGPETILAKLPKWFLALFYLFSPAFIFVLTKKKVYE